MRNSGASLVFAALIASHAPAFAADPLPKTGAVKLAAYAVCRSLAIVDMGPAGSQSSAECNGIVKTQDGSKLFDNLAIRCLEEARARPDGYRFFGTCVQTDGDGDKIFMTYEGPEGGPLEWLGGTGKYKDFFWLGKLDCRGRAGQHVEPFCLHTQLRGQLEPKREVISKRQSRTRLTRPPLPFIGRHSTSTRIVNCNSTVPFGEIQTIDLSSPSPKIGCRLDAQQPCARRFYKTIEGGRHEGPFGFRSRIGRRENR